MPSVLDPSPIPPLTSWACVGLLKHAGERMRPVGIYIEVIAPPPSALPFLQSGAAAPWP